MDVRVARGRSKPVGSIDQSINPSADLLVHWRTEPPVLSRTYALAGAGGEREGENKYLPVGKYTYRTRIDEEPALPIYDVRACIYCTLLGLVAVLEAAAS